MINGKTLKYVYIYNNVCRTTGHRDRHHEAMIYKKITG